MILLMAILFVYMAVVHLMALYALVSFKIPATKLKIWWLRNYQHYHKTRPQYRKYTQTLLDAFFRVDPDINNATFGTTPQTRICIHKVLRMPYEPASFMNQLIDAEEVLTWDTVRQPFEGGDVVRGAVLGDSDCIETLLLPVVENAVDVTEDFKQMWQDEKNGFISVENDSHITYIQFSGYSNPDNGTPAQLCRTVYTSDPIVFPPKHPNVSTMNGIRKRQVLDATMDGEDVTDVIKSLAGPHSDFFARENPLSYWKLWLIMWFEKGTQCLGDVVIEDTLMEESVW